jgi:predicted CXXCH cytochrome family protein
VKHAPVIGEQGCLSCHRPHSAKQEPGQWKQALCVLMPADKEI